ncbi:bacterial surface protein 26-residue repeat [uncultured Ruminococcus sp.]|uniref:fibronectin type III domain-containing protein n=1 Tax=Huintestinicola butyrica TaxID=2981728 RepID=UPI0008222CCD|nr:fibronectin type III domain-containing protein [Huintestinicola butyrica]MCU6727859.1 fibronectin type III domain-containing protein [Huintestinicola butyrica]SCI96578.1 bacterial surface protein 26-residue repeat [uncultured Ruminococcus sp.]
MKKQIKRITAVAAAAALAISFTFPAELGLADLGVGGNAIAASAASSGNCGDSGSNVTWLLDDNGTLTISGSGKIEDYRSDIDQPWYSNRSDITSVVIEPGVTSIGSLAFYECSNLTSITIPSGLTSIGEQAFGNCTGLTSITIPSGFISIGDYAFWNCTGLTSITIQNGVTSIGTGAFWNCTGLTSITIPSSVTSIGVNVFYNCTGLTDITVDSNNSSFCSESGVLFNKDKTTLIYYPLGKNDSSYTIPDGVTVIEQYAFYCNSKLTSVTIPSGVTSIGEMAFRECSGLTSVIVPSSVTSIEYNAFWCCFNLIIYIPGGITIGIDAFYSTAAKITYTVDSSNNVKITDISLSSGNTVDIPPEIDGKTVIAVDEDHRHKVGNHTCVTNTTPTCIKKATCGICGQDYYGDHDLSHHNAVPHTCTADGTVEYWDCSVCGKKFSDPNGTAEITNIADPNDPARHSLVKTDEKAPTCTDNGNRAYWTCTECKNIFSDDAGLNPTTLADVTVFATGHTWSNDWSSDGTGHWHDCVNANCPITENNQKVGYAAHTPGADATETTPQTCDVCGYELAPALGHIHANHLTFIAEVPETCTADGVKAHYECECGKLFADDQAATEVTLESLKIAAHHTYGTDWESDNDDDHYHVCSVCSGKADVTPHSYDSGMITIPATETTEGVKTYTCSVCHHTKTETVPKLSHTHSLSVDYSKDETGHWHACSGCTEKVDFEAHTEDSGTVTVQPTETTEGIRVYSCTVCGYVIRTETVPALASEHTHSYGTAWKYDSTNHWHECSCGEKTDISQHISNGGVITVPPTATTTGVRVYSCYICGYAFRTETIPAAGYDYYPTYPSYPIYPTYPTYPVFLTPSVFTEELTVNAEADGSTVTLSWDEVQKAEKYYVYQYKDGRYVKIKTTTDTSVTLKGLKNGETYKFLVRYSIGRKLSPMTYSYKITVKVYYKPIAKAASTENSVKLTWQAVPNAQKYAICKYVDGKAVKLCETEKLAVRINKLTPDTEYQYIVRAYVDGKWTTMTKSDIVTVNTDAE